MRLVVPRTEVEGCHSEPKRSEGEESRPTGCSMRDSSAYGLRMTGHQNQCGELLVVCHDDFEGLMSAASFPRTRESRQNNRRLLLDLPGCPPEPVLSEVEGRA